MQVDISLNPRRTGLILFSIALYLALQSFFTEYLLENIIGDTTRNSFTDVLDLFSVNLEVSIPTWYATLLLFMASVLLMVISLAKYRAQDIAKRYWLGLALIFLYLSMDEGAAIHEILSEPLQKAFNTSGYLNFAWQIVAVPLVLIFGLLYLRFIVQLPSRMRNLFILAGVTYLSGALVVEAISANEWRPDGNPTLTYLGIATIEETLEMVGVVIFIYSLLTYINQQNYSFAFTPLGALQSPAKTDTTQGIGVNLPRFAMGMVLVILVANLGFYYQAQQMAPSENTERLVITPNDTSVDQGVRDELADEDILFVYATTLFNLNNPASHQLVRPLLADFTEVTVIILPNSEETIILATNTITLEQEALVDILHQYGETNFVIFDSTTIRTFVTAAPSS